MEVNDVQTQTAAIAPLQTPEETAAPAEETTTPATRQATPTTTEAFTVNISAEARAEGEAGNETEEAQTPVQGTAGQVYTSAGEIA